MVKRTVIFLVVTLILFLILAWYFSNIFTYIIISLVLATILRPLTDYVSNRQIWNVKIPRVIAIFFSFFSLVVIISLFVILFIPLISEQAKIFASLNYEDLINQATKPINEIESFIINNGWTEEEPGFLRNSVRVGLFTLIKEIKFADIFTNVLSITGSLFIGLMAVIFITFFLLYERGLLRRQVINHIPNQYFEVSIAALYKTEKLLSNYLLGLIFQMISIFTIAFTGLSIFGIKYSATIALFAAVINIIPYMGPILGATFGIFVGISTTPDLSSTNDYLFFVLKIVSVFGVVQLTDNVLLQPLIFSKSVKAHPLEIFIIIFAGATLAGVLGMIAAIPVYTILRVSAIEMLSGYKSYRVFKD